jgi:hypothetical protein
VVRRHPLILEGDGVDPAIVERPDVREAAAEGLVRAAFVLEADEQAVVENMLARGQERGWARLSWLHGRWLAAEAEGAGLPVLAPRPWETLADRLLAEVGPPEQPAG